MRYQIQFFECAFDLKTRTLKFSTQTWKRWKNYKSETGAKQAIAELRKRSKWVSPSTEMLPELVHLYRYRIVEK